MSLRNKLLQATELRVACASTRNSQLLGTETATGSATDSQQTTANPHEFWGSSATGNATPSQLAVFEQRNSTVETEKLRVAFATTRNTQLSSLTAHRLPAALIESINRCCDFRGDDHHNRADLISESEGCTAHEMADLIEHFDGEAERWRCATGQTYWQVQGDVKA